YLPALFGFVAVHSIIASCYTNQRQPTASSRNITRARSFVMVEPPSGTVTFLFTDIEGSTQLWERYPEAMRAAQARHEALLRAAIEEHGGYVFKTVGDAFCAAFATAAQGLNAILIAQRALAAEVWDETGPIKVRAALHTGAVESRDGD